MKTHRFRLYSSILLFLALAKLAVVSKPLTLYAPENLISVAQVVAKQNGLILTPIASSADYWLTLDGGRTIGREPVAVCIDAGTHIEVPILDKSPLLQSVPVDGYLPHEAGYPKYREINLVTRPLSLLEKLWQGIRILKVGRTMSRVALDLQPTVVALAGDIMLGRRVGEKILEKGPEYPFAKVYSVLQAADITFANLEAPLCITGEFINLFRAHPAAVAGLKLAGIDVVSLANNHILDCHQEGMLETWEHLNRAGILQVGTGMNLQEAVQGAVIDANGMKVGFLAFTETWFLYSRKGIEWVAGSCPGVAPIDLELIVSSIKRFKQAGVQVVIVSLHWGVEYSQTVAEKEAELAKAIIDAGGDVVVGHHPHVVKPWGFYKGKPVFFSLGNFIFDTLRPPLSEQGLLVELVYLEGLRDVHLTVTRLNDCQVELTKLPPPEANVIIN